MLLLFFFFVVFLVFLMKIASEFVNSPWDLVVRFISSLVFYFFYSV